MNSEKTRIYFEIYFFIMKMQIDCLMSEIIIIVIEYSDFQMIMIFFIFSKFLDSEKKSIKRKLIFFKKIMNSFLLIVSVFLMKNLFLTNLLTFCFLIFSVISVIQFSFFSEALFSDFLKSVFSVFSFMINLSVSVLLIFFLADTSMYFQCSKILRFDMLIWCVRSNKYVKCVCCSAEKTVCFVMSLLLKHKLFAADNNKFLLSFFLNYYEFKSWQIRFWTAQKIRWNWKLL